MLTAGSANTLTACSIPSSKTNFKKEGIKNSIILSSDVKTHLDSERPLSHLMPAKNIIAVMSSSISQDKPDSNIPVLASSNSQSTSSKKRKKKKKSSSTQDNVNGKGLNRDFNVQAPSSSASTSTSSKNPKSTKTNSSSSNSNNTTNLSSKMSSLSVSSKISASSSNDIWYRSDAEEKARIREFWLNLGEEERRGLVVLEKEAVLKKMREQQKANCNCSVCGRKR